MTKEELSKRIQELTQAREQHLANANAAQGAITELTGWLNKLATEDVDNAVKPKRGRPKANDYPKEEESDGA